MGEFYNGFKICTGWNDKECGYDFSVYDNSGKEVFSSRMPYFYEENAVKAAKEEIDRRLNKKI